MLKSVTKISHAINIIEFLFKIKVTALLLLESSKNKELLTKAEFS